jgi:indolepyruvate ferredoxin oxidoreductase
MGINQGPISLDQKYTQGSGHVFLTGIQALVRLPMAQIRRDRAAGLNTAGLVTGYRGSPLGGYDQQLFAARKHLEQYNIKFQPGVNEDLAATAIWGSQQLNLSPGARHDGVVGIWYGKGPGVDRCGDVFRHGNAAGSAKNGGVLCLAGDDHGAKSSTVPHQSDHAFISALMPYLYPSSIHEMIEMGLLGIAMSRYSGCWVGMKVITETVETTAEIDLTDEMKPFIIPADFEMPPGGLNLRWPDDRYDQDRRLQDYKGFAAIAFARANKVNRITMDSPNARFGIMASGKSYEDIRQALRELGVTPEVAAKIGLRLYKIGMPWPLEPEGVRQFAVGLEEIFIIEERREIVENQVKQELFNWRDDVRPRIVGKMDDHDKRFLPFAEELSVASLASSLTERLRRLPARRISVRAVRTTPRPKCRRAAAPSPASGVTSWRCGWIATLKPSPIWAARACRGWVSHRSPTKNTCSPISAMAPISIRAVSPFVRPSHPAPTSPTRSSTTTRPR